MLNLLQSVRLRSVALPLSRLPVPLLPVSGSRCLSSAADVSAEDSPAALNSTVVEPISARYTGGVSPTARVIEVLKSGPKTRKQIFYALNRGAPAAIDQPAHAYPTGVLRNPTHLRVILHSLMRTSRLTAKPYTSVESRLGAAEHASVADLMSANPHSANLLSTTAQSGAASSARGAAKSSQAWVYILRDWSDPGFAAKGPEKQAARVAKLERQRLRKVEKIEQANRDGIKLPLGRPIALTFRQRAKAEKARKKREYQENIRELTAAYRASVEAAGTDGQPSTLDVNDEMPPGQLLDDLVSRQVAGAVAAQPDLSDADKSSIELKVRSLAYKFLVHDSERAFIAKVQTENPKYTTNVIKAMCKERQKIMRKYQIQ